jgi:hypothetical protein
VEKTPYQIQTQDYPKLLRYKITKSGFYHMEELITRIYIEDQIPTMHTLVNLGILLRVNMCQTMNMENESMFQDVSNRAKKFGGVEPEYITECVKSLIGRGLVEANPQYDRDLALQLHNYGLHPI